MKSIDEEIQSHFDDHYQRVIINILFTNGWLCCALNQQLEKFNLTRQQYNILRILKGQYPHGASILLIQERMLDKMSDASRIVGRLLNKQLIVKLPNPTDRRYSLVSINKKGLNLLEEVRKQMNSRDFISKSLTEEEAILLSHLLDKVRQFNDE